jgi:hypothetical protein
MKIFPAFSIGSGAIQIMEMRINTSPGTHMKTVKKCYFGTAVLSLAFLLETFLPVQIF